MEKRLDIKITGDNSGFARAASSTIGTLRSLQGTIASLGIAYYTKQAIDWAGSLKDASLRIGVGVEMLQAMERAAASAGVSLEDLTLQIQKLVEAQAEAVDKGSASPKGKAFTALGISMEELRGLNPEQLFLRVAHAIENAGNGSEVLAASIDLFGKSGGKALAAIRDGFAGVAEQIKATDAVLKESEINRLDEIGDKMTEVGLRLKATFGSFVVMLDKASTHVAALLTYFKYGAGMGEAGTDMASLVYANDALSRGQVIRRPDRKVVSSVDRAFQSSVEDYEKMMAKDATDANSKPRGVGLSSAADSLARIGGFRGGAASRTDQLLRDQAQILKSIDKRLERLNSTVEVEQ